MKRSGNTSQHGCFDSRPVILLCAGVAFLSAVGMPGAKADTRLGTTLTFTERVAYQYAIEEVYWRHRIWPRSGGENPRPKPPLDAVVSQRQIEHKVKEYLRKSQLVADRRGTPITRTELQTEMERMASHTRQPEVLGELLEAL